MVKEGPILTTIPAQYPTVEEIKMKWLSSIKKMSCDELNVQSHHPLQRALDPTVSLSSVLGAVACTGVLHPLSFHWPCSSWVWCWWESREFFKLPTFFTFVSFVFFEFIACHLLLPRACSPHSTTAVNICFPFPIWRPKCHVFPSDCAESGKGRTMQFFLIKQA